MDYERLSDESLNVLQNFYRSELLSVAHQIHFLSSHYRGTYDQLVSVICAQLGRMDIEDQARITDHPALRGLAPTSITEILALVKSVPAMEIEVEGKGDQMEVQ
jgi:hypothetical protein